LPILYLVLPIATISQNSNDGILDIPVRINSCHSSTSSCIKEGHFIPYHKNQDVIIKIIDLHNEEIALYLDGERIFEGKINEPSDMDKSFIFPSSKVNLKEAKIDIKAVFSERLKVYHAVVPTGYREVNLYFYFYDEAAESYGLKTKDEFVIRLNNHCYK
jgi:hypothetical protein